MVEGGDGAGKSTQTAALQQALTETGHQVVRTREPGGTELAEKVRALVLDPAHAPVAPHTEALLFAAARADHVDRLIRPCVERGIVVLCDRFVDSSVAYQGAARGLGLAEVATLNEWALQGLVPDLTVVLDVDSSTAETRRERRGVAIDRMESEDRRFHDVVNQTFRDLAALSPQRYLVVDASLPPAEITSTVLERIHKVLAGEVSA